MKNQPTPPRPLGFFDLLFLGIGSIMGTGVFVLTGAVAAQAGPGVMVAFAIAAICAAFSAMCYAEMAGMLPPTSGSAYLYARLTLGPHVGFVLGWILSLIYLVGAALLAVGWSGYATSFMEHTLGLSLPQALVGAPWAFDAANQTFHQTGNYLNLPAALILLGIAWLLNRGVVLSARLNGLLVVTKLAVVVVFIVCALPHVSPARWTPLVVPNRGTFGDGGVSGIFSGAMVLFFSYMGFDAVSAAAAEAKNPKRHIPLAILASLLVCALLYMLTAACLTGLVPYQALHVPHPLAIGAQAMGMGWLEIFIDVGALIGLFTVILAQLFVQPRIVAAMAQDGLLPQALALRDPVHGLLVRQTYLAALITAVAAGVLPVAVLGEFTSLGILLMFAVVSLGVMVQRLQRPLLARSFVVPGGPFVIPGLSVGMACGLMACASKIALVEMGLWVATGLGLIRLRQSKP